MVLRRRPEVEEDLELARRQAVAAWPALASSLRPETIATLARCALAEGNGKVCSELVLEHLHLRAVGIAINNSKGLAQVESQEVVEKVLHLITETVLTTKEPIHYLEVSFGSFVKRKTLNFARDARRRGAAAETLELNDSEVREPILDTNAAEADLKKAFLQSDIRLALGKVLPRFPEPVQAAFRYWFEDDLPIETVDPAEISIARLLGRDKRTVYLWLRKVFDGVKKEIGEEYDY